MSKLISLTRHPATENVFKGEFISLDVDLEGVDCGKEFWLEVRFHTTQPQVHETGEYIKGWIDPTEKGL